MKTKLCNKCKSEKTLDSFYKNSAMKDGKDNYCKVCRTNQNRTKRYDKAYKERPAIQRNKAYILSRTDPCVICGEPDPVCIDFHHINPETKNFIISAARGRSHEVVKAELDKCVCLCANCHRKYHAGKVSLPIEIQSH